MSMRSQGEIEAAVCDVVARFQQEYLGRGPRGIHTHLVDNKVFVHLEGVLSTAEQRLIDGGDPLTGRGAELLKQFRNHLVLTGRPLLESLVRAATGSDPVCLHHDLSTLTGEEMIVVTLASAPRIRDRRRR